MSLHTSGLSNTFASSVFRKTFRFNLFFSKIDIKPKEAVKIFSDDGKLWNRNLHFILCFILNLLQGDDSRPACSDVVVVINGIGGSQVNNNAHNI